MDGYVKDYKSGRGNGGGNSVLGLSLVCVPLICALPWLAEFATDTADFHEKEDVAVNCKQPRYADSWGTEYVKTDGYGILVDGRRQSGKMLLPDVVYMFDRACQIRKIGRRAFEGSYLTSVTLQKYLSVIDDFAFADSKYLTSMSIPKSVEHIGYSAFEGCERLTRLVIEDGTEALEIAGEGDGIYNSPFYDKAFRNCPLETLYAGRDFEYGYDTDAKSHDSFNGIRTLKTLIFGKHFTCVRAGSFDDCDALTSIYCMGTVPCGIEPSAFDSRHYDNATVYVPQGSLTAYRQSEAWADFKNIKEYDMAVVIPQLLGED